MIALPQKLPRWLAPALFVAALGAAFWRAPNPAAPAFVPPPAAAASALPALFAAQMLPQAAESAHAATLAQLQDGRLAAAWFAGSREGAADVAIWFSTQGRDGWSQPQPIANRESTAGGVFAHVRKVGNPVLHVEGSWLHLWYVSVSIGGWAGSSINHSVSTDGGQSWTKPTKLQTSPFANISTLVRTQPLPLADGGLGLPVYHEFIAKHGEWLRLSPTGQIVDKTRMIHPVRTLQPAVVALDEQRALALLRDAGPGPGQVQVATTDNGGLNWGAGEALPIPNPNSSVALLRLKSGRLLLAGNPPHGREALLLWISADEGRTWQASRSIEAAADGGAEFSYPALLLGRDGRIHVAYTWRREGIKVASFSEAWLDGGQP
ncbi:sialidase family protein [Dechloromonas sp. A34]|uniref:sialidase family protein n=1 Tax=Dechloromonas sp. A34 TaxID=447588 RepID=UPI002249462B|nr:sialidase family protein [Dechloromonas sp. A34]